MLTREQIIEAERRAKELHSRVKETFTERSREPAAESNWRDACAVWHSSEFATDILWSDGFMARLRDSQREAVSDAILFLEVDPWYFRSGYLKARLIRGLKRAKLTERDKLRLRNVIWNVARGRNRPEFRKYCALAVRIRTREFEDALLSAAAHEKLKANGKLGYLAKYLAEHK